MEEPDKLPIRRRLLRLLQPDHGVVKSAYLAEAAGELCKALRLPLACDAENERSLVVLNSFNLTMIVVMERS